MEPYSTFHNINIILHVTAGSLALTTGLAALIAAKGGALHKLIGKLFLLLMAVVITTGLIGVFVFGRNTFLLVITVLSGYLAFSGYRIIELKSNKLKLADVAVCILSLASVSYFLYYFKSVGMIWSPVIIYSTVGYFVMIAFYDLIRYLIPKKTYKNLWMYEHVLKMVSAFSGLLSAFIGTMFPQYQPYSQFLPSVLGAFIAIGFMISISLKRKDIAAG